MCAREGRRGGFVEGFCKGGVGEGGEGRFEGGRVVDAPRSSIKRAFQGQKKTRARPERHSHPLSLIM